MKVVAFEDVLGEHLLSGVEHGVKPRGPDDYEDAATLAFVLDGMVYIAVEDPSDGYRSSMEGLFLAGPRPEVEFHNDFPPVPVIVRQTPKVPESYGVDDTLDFVVRDTNLVVLTIGTDNMDDYYPSFVANFHPENLPFNNVR